ncbi:MAG: hypothetical protein LLH30_19000 [Candidatus Manganitrophus sp. SA1]|nr:hypothetical protein [Candidatus Manganitrophus morganii]
MAACIALCRDCADICLLTAEYMSRFSKFHLQSALLCAEVCEACAAECDRMAASHSGRSKEILQRCADLCRRCAASCRRIAQTGQTAA